VARFNELDQLRDALGARLGAALGRVDPSDVVFAVEGGKAVEEFSRIGFGGKSLGDIGGEGLALGALEHQFRLDQISDAQSTVPAIRRPQWQEISFAELLESAAHAAAIDRASDVVALSRPPRFYRVEGQDEPGAAFFGALDLSLERSLLSGFEAHEF